MNLKKRRQEHRKLAKQWRKLHLDCERLFNLMDVFYQQVREWDGVKYCFNWEDHPEAKKRLFDPYNRLLDKSARLQKKLCTISLKTIPEDLDGKWKPFAYYKEDTKNPSKVEINLKKMLAIQRNKDKIREGDRIWKGDTRFCVKEASIYSFINEYSTKREEHIRWERLKSITTTTPLPNLNSPTEFIKSLTMRSYSD